MQDPDFTPEELRQDAWWSFEGAVSALGLLLAGGVILYYVFGG